MNEKECTVIRQLANKTWGYIMAAVLNCQERKGLVFNMSRKAAIKYTFGYMESRCESPDEKAAYAKWNAFGNRNKFNIIAHREYTK